MRSSFLQVGFASAAHLKFIPKSTNGPLQKEYAKSLKLKACIEKSEIQCGLCVLIGPHWVFICWSAGYTAKGWKNKSSVTGLQSSYCTEKLLGVLVKTQQTGISGGVCGLGDQCSRQIVHEFLRHNGVQLWQSVGKSICSNIGFGD